jgi:DNA-binding CsgD family transcriptional regulator
MDPTIEELHEEIRKLKEDVAFWKSNFESIPGAKFITEAQIENKKYKIECIFADNGSLQLTGYKWRKVQAMGAKFGRLTIHPVDYYLSEQSFLFLSQEENDDKTFGAFLRFKHGNGKYVQCENFVKIIGRVAGTNHIRFMNVLIPLDENTEMGNFKMQEAEKQNRKGTQKLINDITKTEMKLIHELLKNPVIEEIALKFKVKKGTIYRHLKNLYEKFDLHSIAELIVVAKDIGLE